MSAPAKPEQRTAAEKSLLEDPQNGLWADPAPGEKRVVYAEFLRRLLIEFSGMAVGHRVVRLNGTEIVGSLDLQDCAGANGSALAGLILKNCDIPDDLKLSNTRLARLSLAGSRIGYVKAHGIQLEGSFDFRGVTPHARGEGAASIAWIDARDAKIGGAVEGEGAHLVAPSPRKKEEIPLGENRFALKLRNCNVIGHVYLFNLYAEGGVSVSDGDIGGDCWLRGAHLIAGEGEGAFWAQGARFGSLLAMDGGFEALGPVWLLGAKLAEGLKCSGAKLTKRPDREQETAFVLDGAEVKGRVWLDEAVANGAVAINNASIAGNFDCRAARFDKADGIFAFQAFDSEIGGSLIFEEVTANGQVTLQNTGIAGDLTCMAACLRNGSDVVLSLNSTSVGGALILQGASREKRFIAAGCVDISHLSVAGSMNCNDAVFLNRKGEVFSGSNAEISGDFFLSNARVVGDINLWGCRISRDFKVSDSRLTSRGFALSIPHWTIRGDFDLQSTIAGKVWCTNSEVEGNLNLKNLRMKRGPMDYRRERPREREWMRFLWSLQPMLNFENSKIGADFKTALLHSDGWLHINLKGVHARALEDTWPSGWGGQKAIEEGLISLDLDNFQYESLKAFDGYDSRLQWLSAGKGNEASNRWLKWLRLQNAAGDFSPQPYRHLARVLRAQGHVEAAREVAIEESWRTRGSKWYERTLKRPFGWWFGFGLDAGKALRTVTVCWVIGTLGIMLAHATGKMVLTTAPIASVIVEGQRRIAVVNASSAIEEMPCGTEILAPYYAADVMLPVIPLHQETVCDVGRNHYIWRGLKFSYSVLSKALTTLALITFSGVLRVRAEEMG